MYEDLGDPLIGFALRVIPGVNPDVDAWRFEGNPYGRSDIRASCKPQPVDTGWQFAECTGLTFSAFMPRQGATGFEIKMTLGRERIEKSLQHAEERDEPRNSPNTSLRWQYRPAGGATNFGIWADSGLVFAPASNSRVDILDARTGTLAGSVDLGALPLTGRGPALAFEVQARNGILYVGTLYKGLVIVDVANPAAPRFLGQYVVDGGSNSLQTFTNIHNLWLSPRGDIIYAVNQSHAATDLRLIDVTTPSSPREIGRFAVRNAGEILDGQHDIKVFEREGRLTGFLNHLGSGLYILDLTDPRNVRQLSHITWEAAFSHAGWPFEANGRYYYAHTDEGFDAGLTVLDVTDLAAPRIVSTFETRDGISIHNIEMVDRLAYVSYYIDGLRVLDLRDPAQPREIAHYDTVVRDDERGLFQGAWGVRYFDGLVYISDMETGVYAFEVKLN